MKTWLPKISTDMSFQHAYTFQHIFFHSFFFHLWTCKSILMFVIFSTNFFGNQITCYFEVKECKFQRISELWRNYRTINGFNISIYKFKIEHVLKELKNFLGNNFLGTSFVFCWPKYKDIKISKIEHVAEK